MRKVIIRGMKNPNVLPSFHIRGFGKKRTGSGR